MTNVRTGLPSRGGHGQPVEASLLHQVSMTLEHGQIIALPTAYVDVTGDPGEDRVLLVALAVPYLNWVVDYSHIAATAIFYLAYDNAVDFATNLFQIIDSGVGSLLANGEDAWAAFTPPSSTDGATLAARNYIPSVTFNKAISLGMFNGANGNLQGGDPGNTLDLSVLFHVYDRSVKRFVTTVESGWDANTRLFA